VIYVESKHGPGVVGLVGGELARYHGFTMSFSSLHVPEGTKGFGGLGYDVSYNRNDVIRYALSQPEAEWVQIWDDDHDIPNRTLISLLDKNVDVVVPLYGQRQPPFNPCIYSSENADGSFNGISAADLEGKTGLLPVASAGAGGVLIRRRVLEAIGDDWFERRGKIGEDHVFFKKCREAGFQPHVALDVPVFHMVTNRVLLLPNDKGLWRAQLFLGPKDVVEYWHQKYRGGA
jgi:hypothetical protein